ncbi:MAG TPA: GntR family transcriptional regulator [Streptosporangiaceae bacterium]|nr:GntR family transcriptional regulator [Streptosporangiaceae bacterium]
MNVNDPLPDQSLSDAVVDRLRTAIWSGVYAPGDRLVERRLAREFGISHIPLREALARLTEEGLVERLPRRGARVASLTPRMLEEVSSLRVVLEQFVVRRLKDRFTPEAHAELQVIVDWMVEAAEQHDLVRVHGLDQQFHQRLWELTDHALLVELAAQMRSRTSHFYRAAAASLGPDEVRRHADSHQQLLDVIASGDRRAAERAMQQHVEQAAQRIADAGLARTEGE